MKCDIDRDPVGRPVTFTCGTGPRPQPGCCVGCSAMTAIYACDAYASGKPDSDTCDRAICPSCSTHIDALNLDVCPEHAQATTPVDECAVVVFSQQTRNRSPKQPCEGALLYPQYLCVRHARLFARWLRHEGGWDQVYANRSMGRTAKRLRFEEWLDRQPADARGDVPVLRLPRR